ncbi:(2Fe-2S)-binding protein [Variovorax sp. VNK109]|uniref:(2Fe-2S)-binding protein n=1 Tax=Variovorax sp. VNK109 TaxID=3400919 RepID=UPI003C0F73F2
MNHELQINGFTRVADTQADTPLLWALRDVLGLTGTKFGCGAGLCGACTVHVDGVATRSCLTPVGSVVGKAITTIEGVGQGPVGAAVQKAWIELDVVQCGYCQPGQIMSATALLSANARPSDAQIDEGMAGNLCRCGTYGRIREAVKRAARTIPITQVSGKA